MTAQGRRGMKYEDRGPGLTRIPLRGGGGVLLDVLKFRRNIMEMKSRDSTMTTMRTRARTKDEDGEFNCVITCALAYAIGSSRKARASERASERRLNERRDVWMRLRDLTSSRSQQMEEKRIGYSMSLHIWKRF